MAHAQGCNGRFVELRCPANVSNHNFSPRHPPFFGNPRAADVERDLDVPHVQVQHHRRAVAGRNDSGAPPALAKHFRAGMSALRWGLPPPEIGRRRQRRRQLRRCILRGGPCRVGSRAARARRRRWRHELGAAGARTGARRRRAHH
eukprot:gene16177-biopygen20253